MRKVSGRMKLELAQYRDLEAFSQFGSELDSATQRALARGARQVATLNQPAFAPWPVEEQVAIIFAANQGHLDDIAPADVPRFNEDLRAALRDEGSIFASIRDSKDLADDVNAKLEAFLVTFVAQRAGTPVTVEPAVVEAPVEAAEETTAA